MTPAYKENNIAIIYASSKYYVPYLDIAIKSVVETKGDYFNYDVIILHKEITNNEQFLLKQNESANISIRFFEIDKEIDSINYNYRPGYAPESFYRVIMPYILKEYDDAIWLDCDTIVKKDIADYYVQAKNNIGSNCIAASKDIDGMASSVCNHENRKQYMRSVLGLKRIDDYFQSGVMYFDFVQIRKLYSLDNLIVASCNPDIMYGDQDVLNYLYRDKVLFMDMSWNTITNSNRSHMESLLMLAPADIVEEYLQARLNPYIIHLATKPWNDPMCENAEDFWHLARDSAFYEEIIKRWSDSVEG